MVSLLVGLVIKENKRLDRLIIYDFDKAKAIDIDKRDVGQYNVIWIDKNADIIADKDSYFYGCGIIKSGSRTCFVHGTPCYKSVDLFYKYRNCDLMYIFLDFSFVSIFL